MVIYVVLENGGGAGTYAVAAYIDKDKAHKHARTESNYYVDSVRVVDMQSFPVKG